MNACCIPNKVHFQASRLHPRSPHCFMCPHHYCILEIQVVHWLLQTIEFCITFLPKVFFPDCCCLHMDTKMINVLLELVKVSACLPSNFWRVTLSLCFIIFSILHSSPSAFQGERAQSPFLKIENGKRERCDNPDCVAAVLKGITQTNPGIPMPSLCSDFAWFQKALSFYVQS